MLTLLLSGLLSGAVMLIFAGAGIANLAAFGAIRADFARWGYPGGFNFVCGGLELAGAAMVLFPTMRIWGLALLAAIMAAAIATLVRNREPFWHIVPAAGISAILVIALTLAA